MSRFLSYLPNVVSRTIIAGFFHFRAWRTVGFRGFHSKMDFNAMSDISVKIVPVLSDNYMYLVIDNQTKDAAIVDPMDTTHVENAVKEHGVQLKYILTTHHHYDHCGLNESLVKRIATLKWPAVKVYGGDDRIPALTDKIGDGDTISLGAHTIKCIFTPCHTTGHICYYIETAGGDKAVFTGDTLFSAGCGRFFEGNATQMHHALIEKLSKLPDDTKVYCGHEYTLANLGFCSRVEPDNLDIKNKIESAKNKRESDLPTIPSTIGEEKLINVFMRVHVPAVQKHTKTSDEISTMQALRNEKNNFIS